MEQRNERRRQIRRLLWRWGQVNETCLRWQRDLDEKKSALQAVTDIKSPIITDMPHGTGISDRTAKAAEKLEALEQLYSEFCTEMVEAIDKELRFQRAMNEAIGSLPRSQGWVLELRYKSEYSYDRIARKTNYAVDYVRRLESKACDALTEKITIE